MSAADLRQELIGRLREEIRRHEREIEAINRQIAQLNPTESVLVRRPIRGGRVRGVPRNEQPLREVIARVMREAGEPMSIKEIIDAVRATGYHSNATNFRSVVSLSLSNNGELFEKVDRGVYTLRAGASVGDDDEEQEVGVGSDGEAEE